MDDTSKTLRRWVTFAGCVLVVVVLYWAQAVLLPIALAILLTFVLAPPVSWLERWIGRIPAVLATVTLEISDVRSAGKGGSVEKLQDTIEDIKTDLGKSEVPTGTISRPVVVTSEQSPN
jgi:hypothetical protein